MQFGLRSVAVLVVALATVAGVPHQAPRSAARCYALSFGPWTTGSESVELHAPLPEGIALSDSLFWPPKHGRPTKYWAVRLQASAPDRRRAFWYRGATDSLTIHLPAWWSTEIMLTFPERGDTLTGRAEIYVDYSPSVPTFAAVTARRRACPAFKIP